MFIFLYFPALPGAEGAITTQANKKFDGSTFSLKILNSGNSRAAPVGPVGPICIYLIFWGWVNGSTVISSTIVEVGEWFYI